jgi:acetyl esterase/lipase
MPVAGGAARQVSKRTGVSEIAWHPKGAFIYFLAVDAPTQAERDRLRLRGDVVVLDAPVREYWEHSPLKYISAARTPTLFLIGENDPRVPAAQSIEIMRALKAQGVPSELHIAPGEGHIWLSPTHQLYTMNGKSSGSRNTAAMSPTYRRRHPRKMTRRWFPLPRLRNPKRDRLSPFDALRASRVSRGTRFYPDK